MRTILRQSATLFSARRSLKNQFPPLADQSFSKADPLLTPPGLLGSWCPFQILGPHYSEIEPSIVRSGLEIFCKALAIEP